MIPRHLDDDEVYRDTLTAQFDNTSNIVGLGVSGDV